MKNIFLKAKKKQRWIMGITGFVVASLVLVACIGDPVEPTPVGYVALYNAAAYEPSSVDIYMNGGKINSTKFDYSKFSGYLNFTQGTSALQFTTQGTTTKLAERTFSVEGGKAYSVYVINQGTQFDTWLLKDSSALVSTDSSRVRFINLSPDSPELDLVVSGTTSPRLFGNHAYKTASQFKSIKANTYSFDIVKADGTVLATVSGNILATGKYYSIIAQGFTSTRPEGNNNSLGLKLLNN